MNDGKKKEIIINTIKTLPYVMELNVWKHCKINLIQSFGSRTRICVNGRGSRLTMGGKCVLRDNVELRIENGGELHIGEKCFINRNTVITCIDRITIGSGTQIANNVTIIDHDHNYKNNGTAPLISSGVTIGKNVWIGANAVILRGSQIGDGAVIGAGAVIKGIVKSGTLVYQERKNNIRSMNKGGK